MAEKEKYLASIKEKKKNGLKDVKFFSANVFGVSEECAYEELNRLHETTDLPDQEILGKHSPAIK